MNRRDFVSLVVSSTGLVWFPAAASVPTPHSWDLDPPLDSRASFIKWMTTNRGEDPEMLGLRWDRFQALVANDDLLNAANKRAFLLTPRELFVPKSNIKRSYDHAYLDIGYGVTISGPHLVGRMTSSLDVKRGDKVLEIGTGSGYQSAYLANLTNQIWTIEIVAPLFERTRALYSDLIADGYTEYQVINLRNADGYYGWEENAPFDKIIVTCGIDHIPPPLLRQLAPTGTMVIPVGPPGAQHVLKVTREEDSTGHKVARSDIYHGRIVPFVPFTKLIGNVISGTH